MQQPSDISHPMTIVPAYSSHETQSVTRKDLPGLPATIQLAAQVAARLGRSALLFPTLPAQSASHRSGDKKMKLYSALCSLRLAAA